MSFKLAFKVPKWLRDLPPGYYTTSQLKAITGVVASSIYMRFDTLGVEKNYKRIGNKWKNVYKWEGAIYYISKIPEEKRK